MPFGKAISAGAGLLGGLSQASAVKKAAKTAQQTQRETLAQQRALFDTQRADQMPYMDAGRNALLDVTDLSGANGREAGEAARQGFMTSPGYEFQLQQGQQAIDRSAAARGMLMSGPTLEATMKFGQGLAAQDFSTYYNRLSDLAKLGQVATSGVSAAASGLSGQIGQAGSNMAQTQASAGGAQASIYGGIANTIGNALGSGVQDYMYEQRRNALSGPGVGNGQGAPGNTPLAGGFY